MRYIIQVVKKVIFICKERRVSDFHHLKVFQVYRIWEDSKTNRMRHQGFCQGGTVVFTTARK